MYWGPVLAVLGETEMKETLLLSFSWSGFQVPGHSVILGHTNFPFTQIPLTLSMALVNDHSSLGPSQSLAQFPLPHSCQLPALS